MDTNFWHERWAKSEIGFHLNDVNPYLIEHFAALKPKANAAVFVPLCGKSKDLIWLAEHTEKVIGIELSKKAVEDFFKENKLTPSITQGERFSTYRYENLTIICGDLFELTADDVAAYQLVYDRASLIAFPADMRARYVEKLNELLPNKTQRLLITVDYPQHEMSGPPFSVTPDEVQQHFSARYEIQCLVSEDILEQSKRFKAKGVSRMLEHVFLLTEK
ncbi:thiopurine S-methyltransferase [Cycloclasticus pugetii]|uniref:thiopurine S-methyltransferase n=1 Tax=Cycloclasticus pugetii TaxID=34068 RepID=UPI002409C3FE|nr:thiopurine S-methyltransferase [Cycloclasticus pugetii]MDF1829854.1 thiopurine S-methyltransferase [Cycloclasticus pugetii]